MKIKLTQMSGYEETIDTSELWNAPSLIWQVYASQPENSPQAKTLEKVHNLLCALNNGKVELQQEIN